MSSEAILNQIREELKAIRAEKRGLEGNRAFMDSGWENAPYPEGVQFSPFDANGIHAEAVFINQSLAERDNTKTIILHCHGCTTRQSLRRHCHHL